MNEDEQYAITLPVDWHFPESIQSRYANNMLVQVGQFEFIISFFEMQLPMLSGSPEENKEKLEEMGAIRAECVSKIVLSPELVPGLINALQTELEKYQSQRSNQ
jgi:Protein of unknown function (DUF3467)